MSDGKKLMQTLSPGEGASSEEDVTLQFLGREWSVQAYIGTPHNGGAVIIVPEPTEIDREVIARRFLAAACVVVHGMDTPATLMERLAVMLCDSFIQTGEKIAGDLASRGKPS